MEKNFFLLTHDEFLNEFDFAPKKKKLIPLVNSYFLFIS